MKSSKEELEIEFWRALDSLKNPHTKNVDCEKVFDYLWDKINQSNSEAGVKKGENK